MFWKGPVFTRGGFKGSGINLESCDVVDNVDGEIRLDSFGIVKPSHAPKWDAKLLPGCNYWAPDSLVDVFEACKRT